jgi:RecQ family ATP-dependent DNA helicase
MLLKSMQQNQIDALRSKGIAVETINGNTPFDQRQEIIKDAKRGHPRMKMLYVTPELCSRDWFRQLLRTIHGHGQLSRFVIDEAHCVSQWGHDFRKDYLGLRYFREQFPSVPIMCATATATSHVKTDIIQTMGLDINRVKCFTMPTCRPNLHFEVRFKSQRDGEKYDDILKWLKKIYERRRQPTRSDELKQKNERTENVSGIIYAFTRDTCDSLADMLTKHGIGAKPYHSKLSNDKKKDHLNGWLENQEGYDIIVATTAFGMGIDKEDVRFVVHYDIPKTFEGFYQEAGRAGRDGKASVCLLYYCHDNKDFMKTIVEAGRPKAKAGAGARITNFEGREHSFEQLVQYCLRTDKCRHQLIANYFEDEQTPKCDWACDWHKNPEKLKRDKRRYDEQSTGEGPWYDGIDASTQRVLNDMGIALPAVAVQNQQPSTFAQD